jgi:hypothetical protein
MRDGAIVASPTAMTVTWRNPDGTTLFTLTDASPGVALQASGKYVQTALAQVLVELSRYDVQVAITDATGTVTTPREVVTGENSA